MARPSEPAPAQALALARSRPPTLGTGRLICVDGPSGAGKTTFAAALGRLDLSSRVVHLDALYDGWDGLPRVGEQLASLLEPLVAGRAGTYRRYDWHAGRYAETVTVEPAPLLVLEGVGAWSPAYAHLVTALVWLDAAPDVRLARAVGRDGAAVEPQLRRWAEAEAIHFAACGTRERADLVVRTDTAPD